MKNKIKRNLSYWSVNIWSNCSIVDLSTIDRPSALGDMSVRLDHQIDTKFTILKKNFVLEFFVCFFFKKKLKTMIGSLTKLKLNYQMFKSWNLFVMSWITFITIDRTIKRSKKKISSRFRIYYPHFIIPVSHHNDPRNLSSIVVCFLQVRPKPIGHSILHTLRIVVKCFGVNRNQVH